MFWMLSINDFFWWEIINCIKRLINSNVLYVFLRMRFLIGVVLMISVLCLGLLKIKLYVVLFGNVGMFLWFIWKLLYILIIKYVVVVRVNVVIIIN